MKKVLAFDFGGTTIKYAIVQEDHQLLYEGKIQTEVLDYQVFCKKIFAIADRMKTQVEGIAVSLPGAVNPGTGEIYSSGAIECLEGSLFFEELQKRYRMPVTFENDASCAALAEFYAGAGRGCRNIVMIVLGTGIGGAAIINGQPLCTEHYFSGEFGYLVLDYENMLTWEDLSGSVISVVRKVKNLGVPYAEMDGEEIFDLYQKDEKVTEILERFYKMLACGCYTIQAIFDPECIIVGGGINRRKDLIGNINRYMEQICRQRKIRQKPRIITGNFLDRANLIGACCHFWNDSKEKSVEI